MNSPYLTGLGAGLVSAVLFLSTATGSLLAMVLFFLVALPGFLAGLGWGWLAALISGISASVAIGLILAPHVGLVYLITLGLPIAVLCYLALLARPSETDRTDGSSADNETGRNAPPAIEWYPVGHLLAWAAVMAGCIAALSVPLLGMDAQSYREAAKAYFSMAIVDQLPGIDGKPVDKEKLEPLIDTLTLLLPASSAIVWLGVITTNMWAAGRITQTSTRVIRPLPDLATLTYPRQLPLAFVGSVMLTLAPGIMSIIATGFAGAFLVAYIIMGLTVLHTVIRYSSMSSFLLLILYLSIIFIGWTSLLVAMVGLGEPIFRLREKARFRHQPPGSTGT